MRNLLLSIGFVFVFNAASAQKLHIDVEWAGTSTEFYDYDNKRALKVPKISDAGIYKENNYLPSVYQKVNINRSGDISYTITNVTYEPLGNNYASIAELLDESIKVKTYISYDRGAPHASVVVVPLRKNPFSGQVEIATSIDLELNVTAKPGLNSRSGRSVATNSVLATGTWYKIAVDADGMYRVDFDFLTNTLGVSGNVSFSSFGIFGNGGGMLPEKNDDDRPDDLKELGLYVVDQNGNGTFEQGDYVVFHGQSPHRWYYESSESKYKLLYNVYTDKNYYFLTTNQGSGKRAQSVSSVGGANATVTDFDDHQYHNSELNNLIGSGRQWYGENFSNFNPTQVINFNFPNLKTSEDLKIKTVVAARSTAASSKFDVFANNSSLVSQSIGTVPEVYTAPFAAIDVENDVFSSTSNSVDIRFDFSSADNNSEGWLDYIELNATRNLVYNGGQLMFRNIDAVGFGKVAEYRVSVGNNSGMQLWDVTDPNNPLSISGQNSGSTLTFTRAAEELRQYVLFDNSAYLTPTSEGGVANQNLHNIASNNDHPKMIIIAPTSLIDPANDLALYRTNTDNMEVLVVELQKIYNEFASGAADITAIRDFMKMIYDRAGGVEANKPKYMLLLGDGTYDYKGHKFPADDFIPSYQSTQSISPTGTYVTDDYYVFLDDGEGGAIVNGGEKMDVALGRMPVSSVSQANEMIAKIKQYESTASFGSWRNDITFMADDEDFDLHLDQSDKVANEAGANYEDYNVDKIFLDAFPQENTPAGERYPEVNRTIQSRIFKGTFMANYVGHGGVTNLAHERIFNIPEIQAFENFDKMPVFVTATCEFSRYDDPERTSAGEFLFANPNGGAIAMVTTVRLVFSGDNDRLNKNFFRTVFEEVDGEHPRLGELTRLAKNATTSNANNRKFTLLGDPALKLGFPEHVVSTTKINGVDVSSFTDTIKALSEVVIEGEVTDESGAVLTGFNGFVYPVIYDKEKVLQTLANDANKFSDKVVSSVVPFRERVNIIYKGKASVVNGKFSFTFLVPKDIDYAIGRGKISYYAENSITDATGSDFNFFIGGASTDFVADDQGPIIDLFMNDEKFVFGGTTDKNPILLVKLEDESGINTVGNGIGHDLTAVLDEDDRNKIILNDFYESELNNYRKGEVRYPLSDLAEGPHTVTVKAWDVHNNSSTETLEFVVATEAEVALEYVLNYPNPFTTNTEFHFEHNRPGEDLDVLIQIFSVSGRLVKSIYQNIVSEGFKVDDIFWDGTDEYGDRLGNGPYLYKVQLKTPDGKTSEKFEKLVILR